MGTISSGVGLISGLNIQDIVSKLMALEARPLDLLKARISETQNQQTAYSTISAMILAAKSSVTALTKSSTFGVRAAESSNTDVLTATASEKTPLGNYSFQVASLVSTHQLVSMGFADRSSTPVGAGRLTFEVGQGNLQPPTAFADLNGGAGIRRGVIRITDRSGASVDVDLRTATDLQDVVDAINGQSSARVQADVRGDSLVISDTTGLGAGNLTVSNVSGYAATDLGIAGTSATGEIVGHDMVYLTASTRLARLNDGNGVGIAGSVDDLQFTLHDGRQINVNLSGLLRFSTRLEELNDGRGAQMGTIRITNRAGVSQDIDLTGDQTLQDVVDDIQASGLSVSVALVGSRLTITDGSGGTGEFKIEDVSGTAAADLGIAGQVTENAILGTSIYRVDTIGAVLRAIQYATNNNGALSAAISPDASGIVLNDTTAGGNPTTVVALNGSRALEDLGLAAGFSGSTLTSRPILSGLNTVLLSSLNGGSGVDTGGLTITRSVGGVPSVETIDVSAARTLQDVITAINSKTDAGGNRLFNAQLSPGGTGITIADLAGGQLTAAGGATATALHLSAANGQLVGDDLNFRYITERTSLADLNVGAGVSYGSTLKITASDGDVATLRLSETAHKTVGDIIKAINDLSLNVTAQVNANGDGIQLTDSAGGAGTLTVSEEGAGTAAADLGILGTATGTVLAGSFARTVEIDGDDTLDDLVAKINAAGAGVTASVVNDGTASAPYRLVLTSDATGTGGQINYTSSIASLNLQTLSEAEDAKVIIGSPSSPSSIVVTSSSNTVKDVIDGLTLQLKSTSSQPVQVNVSRDSEQAVTAIDTMVKSLNSALDKISELTRYDSESGTSGILLGDAAVQRVRDRIYARFTTAVNSSGLSLTRLAQVGITIGGGAHLQFDEAKFAAAFEKDPEAVTKLFTLTTTDGDETVKLGLAAKLEEEINALTDSGTGLISRQFNSLQDKVDLYNERAKDMQELLDLKEARLTAQFTAMESALAALQGQQAALAALSNLASSFSSSMKANSSS